MNNSFVMGHINRADRNLLILYTVIFTLCSLVVALVYVMNGLYTPYYVCLSLNLLVIIGCTAVYTHRVNNLERRATYKTITKFGNFESVRMQIDAEAVSNASVRKGQLHFTRNWILQPYFSGLHIIHRPTLVWAYAKDLATRHYVNFIPTGTTHTYSVFLHYTEPSKEEGFISVRSLEIKTRNEAASGDLLGYILLYTPWVVAGYTPEIAGLWKTKPSEMLAFVTNRYNAFVLGATKQSSQQRQYTQRPSAQADTRPFEVLGVSPSATEAEVKAAYRNKAWVAHPDHGGSNELMMEVNTAYEAICKSKGWSA